MFDLEKTKAVNRKWVIVIKVIKLSFYEQAIPLNIYILLQTQTHITQDYRATQFRIFDGHTAIKPNDADISKTHDVVLNICW